MANRRYGQGNRSHGGYGGGAVNPWEGGNFPGNRGYSDNSNMIPHLSETQAQLALALSKLLQPQQPQPLLSMDTMNPSKSYNDYALGRGDYGRNRNWTDFRRHDSFGKNFRNRDENRRRDNKNKNKDNKKNQNKKNDDKKKEEKSSDDNSDVKIENEESNETEQKRDWKDEKNTENKSGGETDGEKMDVEEKKEGEGEEKEKTKKEGRFAGIPTNLLICRICDKKMWDGESFEKHLKGKAHQLMLDAVEESYRIKANMLRESVRLAEEKNSIEIDRMKRASKNYKPPPHSYCTMCQLDYYGFRHRGSVGHKTLKQLLHPRCKYCDKEFATRMEWETHRHTVDHLKKKATKMAKRAEQIDRNEPLVDEDDENIPDSFDDLMDVADVVTDITDDMEDLKNRIPTYTTRRSVGRSMLQPVSGFLCSQCQRFFTTEDKAEKHLRTERHFNNFIKILKEKESEADEKKRKAKEEAQNEEGNWKRRKVDDDKDEENAENGQDNDESAMDTTAETTGEDTKNGTDLYNPEDSFVDPNEILVQDKKDEDKIWQEVDKELGNILDDGTTAAENAGTEENAVKKEATPTRGARARRGRRAN